MTLARKQLVSIVDTPYYHVVTRCVRRAYLAGFDKLTKTSFEHRRQWIVDRMLGLTDIFSIDICSYAVMSNHYHIVLKVNDNKKWSIDETLKTWNKLYSLPYLCDKYLRNEIHTNAEIREVKKIAKEYRKRLMSISWFMKCLNEYIALKANAEDNCKGHFYDLHPCKSHYVPPSAFKFNPVKFSGSLDLKVKLYLMKEHCHSKIPLKSQVIVLLFLFSLD